MRMEGLRGRAPAFIMIAASGVLAALFSLPLGRERRAATRYAPLAGYAATFARAEGGDAGSSRGAAWGLVARALRRQYPPVQASEVLRRVEPARADPAKTQARRAVRARKRAERPAVPAAVSVSTAAAPPRPVDPWGSAQKASDAYENDASRYPLDVRAESGGVALRLRGLSRKDARFILKISVTNRGNEDFFVRDVAISAGRDPLDSRAFVRLFVEPGRTREGFVVFERPRPGAVVHVALKEDGVKGRVVVLAVPYPF